MSLREAFHQAGGAIIDALDDVARPVVFLRHVPATAPLDPLDETSPVGTITSIPTKALIDDYEISERDEAVLADDRRIRLSSRRLLTDARKVLGQGLASFRPTQEDALELLDTGERVEVVQVETDVAESWWTLQVRRPG